MSIAIEDVHFAVTGAIGLPKSISSYDIAHDMLISNYDKVLLGDVNGNGLFDAFLIGWEKGNGKDIYWQLTERTIHEQHISYDILVSDGRFSNPSNIVDAIIFKSKKVPFENYLLLRSETLIYVYRPDIENHLLSLIKVIPTDAKIHQVISIQIEDHPILSKYNLLLHVGTHLILKRWTADDAYESAEETIQANQVLDIEGEWGMTSQGYVLNEVYCHEKSEGRLEIWWEKSTGEGQLVFYSMGQDEENLKLSLESAILNFKMRHESKNQG